MGFIYLTSMRNPSLVASYQTSPGNLYGTPFAIGMENYFQKIKAHFGQSMFDQLLTEFAQQSNLYVDEIKVDEWHIYGSSRLGVYEANRTISKRVARDLNNDNQITNNEYVIETPEEVTYLYSSYQLERGAKRNELANHLGNVLTVISDKKTANFTGSTFTNFTAERISATDYSPFGAPLAGRSWNGGEYRYGFNNMEKDNEINGTGNAYDFGARICDSRLGRWLSVDPLSYSYHGFSCYNLSLNSPLTLKDENGEWVKKSIKKYDKNCKIIPWYNFWTKAKTVEITFTIHNAKLYNGSQENPSPDALQKAAQDIQKDIEDNLTTSTNAKGQTIITGVIFATPIEVVNDLENVVSSGSKSDNLIYITDIDVVRNITKVWGATGFNYLGENMMVLDIDEGRIRNKNLHHKGVPSHELLHGLGLNHSPNPKSLIHESGTGKLLFEDSKALLNSSLFNKEYKTTLKKVERIEKK